jgi:serine/threonine protein phosphatase PrpC
MDPVVTVTGTAALTCPACGAATALADWFCEACGHELAHADGRREPDRVARPARGVLAAYPCAECGAAEISPDGYCERCGARQSSGRDHVEVDLGSAAGVSDRGLRHPHNEDALRLASTALPGGEAAVITIVCDGVSSTPRSAIAAGAAAWTGEAFLTRAIAHGADAATASREAVVRAAAAVAALDEPSSPVATSGSPSCTYVSAVVTRAAVTIASVGDTRAYWLTTPGTSTATASVRLTEDDSWAAQEVASGDLTEIQAYADPRAHAITGWLGADAGPLEPHVRTFIPGGPGAVLVCSDGLWNYLPDADRLAAAIPAAARAPLQSARDLVRLALAAGGHDNVTVVVIACPPRPAAGGDDREPGLADGATGTQQNGGGQ